MQDLDREEAELPARQQPPEAARRRAAATAHESELAEGDTDARLQPGEVRALDCKAPRQRCAVTDTALCSLATATTPLSLRLLVWTTSAGQSPRRGLVAASRALSLPS